METNKRQSLFKLRRQHEYSPKCNKDIREELLQAINLEKIIGSRNINTGCLFCLKLNPNANLLATTTGEPLFCWLYYLHYFISRSNTNLGSRDKQTVVFAKRTHRNSNQFAVDE